MRTNEDLMSELIYNAQANKHKQFQYLRTWREYYRARKIRRVHALLVESIRKSTNKLFKNYCKSITENRSDVLKLLAYCTTVNVLRFYEEELQTISDMIIEYECYLAHGNWTDILWGTARSADKLYDHRSL